MLVRVWVYIGGQNRERRERREVERSGEKWREEDKVKYLFQKDQREYTGMAKLIIQTLEELWVVSQFASDAILGTPVFSLKASMLNFSIFSGDRSGSEGLRRKIFASSSRHCMLRVPTVALMGGPGSWGVWLNSATIKERWEMRERVCIEREKRTENREQRSEVRLNPRYSNTHERGKGGIKGRRLGITRCIFRTHNIDGAREGLFES